MAVTSLTPSARPAAAPTPPGNPARVLAATTSCLARWGLAKTTLDDIAREAGVSRATVYRLFPGGRDVVVRAALAAEIAEAEAAMAAQLRAADDVEERLVVLVTGAVRLLREHPALQYLLAHEPETVLPHLAFGRLDALLDVAARRIAPWFGGDVRGAEWIARVVVSYTFNPSPHVDLADRDDARTFLRTHVLPALDVPRKAQR